MAGDKQELEGLRAYAQVEADELEALLNQHSTPEEERANEAAYIQRSKALFHDIATRIKAFLSRLYLESKQELGPAPCKYTVMGLGSMALQQMTPYSDLEFAILMEECSDEVTARAYFKRLTHLVNFRVINLGETKIPNSKHGVNLEHLIKRGINLDLGGKTPLGRQDKPYTLIQTVADMLCYLRNEGNKVGHIDKNLPYILESTCYVHGDEQLHKAYEAQKIAFLADPEVYKSRARKRVLEGVVEWDYRHPDVTGPKLKQKLGNIEEFRPQFDQGKPYNVKKEIYRLPDRLLYGLAFYYGIVPRSGWDAVAQLFDRKIIRKEAVHYLGYIMSFANILRLNTYLHYDQQHENVAVLHDLSQEDTQAEIRAVSYLPPKAFQVGSSLFKYYYTAVPLHCRMEAFFDVVGKKRVVGIDEESSFFFENTFYDDSAEAKRKIRRRLLQRGDPIVCLTGVPSVQKRKYVDRHSHVGITLRPKVAICSDFRPDEYTYSSLSVSSNCPKETYDPQERTIRSHAAVSETKEDNKKDIQERPIDKDQHVVTVTDSLFNAIRDVETDAVNQLLSTNQELLEVLSERDDETGRKQEYTLLIYRICFNIADGIEKAVCY
ncbi:MAG: DUF294 nucleotidyltransferase-like domain-containing protein, partial [Bacteroidota bacterium]